MKTTKLKIAAGAVGALVIIAASTLNAQNNQDAQQRSDTEHLVLLAVAEGSKAWKDAFNSGDAAGAAALYEDNAVMAATPFGTYTGREAIEAFWADLVKQGYDDVIYNDTVVTVLDDRTAKVSASWTMNNASGIITNETWVVQPDGRALMREDHFEVTGSN